MHLKGGVALSLIYRHFQKITYLFPKKNTEYSLYLLFTYDGRKYILERNTTFQVPYRGFNESVIYSLFHYYNIFSDYFNKFHDSTSLSVPLLPFKSQKYASFNSSQY